MFRYIQIEAPRRAAMIEAPSPATGPDQALVETTLTGISTGTERMWFEGSAGALRSGRRSYPYAPGYALVGHVVAAGPDFAGAAIGTRVFAMKPHASHAIIAPDDLWCRMAPELSDEDALGIALTATALHTVDRASLAAGDAAAVAGIGMFGAILVQVLAATVGGPVTAVTRNPEKRVRGAAAVRSYGDVDPAIGTWFECSGAADNVARLADMTGPRGKIVLAGSYTSPIALDGEPIFANELTIAGARSIGDGADRRRNFERAAALVENGKVRIRDLVTHRFAAEDFRDAYRLIAARAPDTMQICLDWRAQGFR